MSLKLSVLDQSLARSPDAATEALQETLQMAQWCETLGYERFWVSEHHAFPSVAGSAPEIILAALGAATKTIRLGSGGIMLPHYSPYKIAEVFSILANLYPDRIDLGIGRAPGADMATAVALATDGRPKFQRFPELVSKLSEYLWSETTQPPVCPRPPANLPLWMLGSSPDSAQLAAQHGLPYNLAAFINPQAVPAFMEYYKSHFQPSSLWPKPYCTLAISVFCAETEQKAHDLHLAHDINLFRFFTGQAGGAGQGGSFMTPEQARDYPVSAQLAAFIESRQNGRAVGSPVQVREQIMQLAAAFGVDEIMAVTNMYYLDDRKRSFQLLKEVFD